MQSILISQRQIQFNKKFYHKIEQIKSQTLFKLHFFFKIKTMNLSTKFISSVGSLIEILIRQKNKQNLVTAFDKIKISSKYQIKRTKFLGMLLCKVYKKYKKSENQQFFSLLIQNRIRQIQNTNKKLTNLKSKSKQFAISLIAVKQKNLKKNLIRQIFNTLKIKSSLIYGVKYLKIGRMINAIKGLEKKYLQDSLKLIKVRRFDIFARYKRVYIMFNLLIKKIRQFQSQTFETLKQFSKSKIENSDPPPKNMLKSESKSELKPDYKVQKQYNQKKKSLESKILQLQQNMDKKQTLKQKQIQKLQNELESINFSYDLLAQDNEALQKIITQRQNSKNCQQKRSNHKQHENLDLNTSVQIKEGQIWKGVICNLLKYLLSVQGQINPEQLIQSISQPLVHKSFYSSPVELEEENNILSEILQAYKQVNVSSQTQTSSSEVSLPISCLNRQKRQFYRILQCLSRWGSSDIQEIIQIQSSLNKLKKVSQ